ncbi:MAG: EAL domain-containing protein [Geitlerinemataceae cyanobacterium]
MSSESEIRQPILIIQDSQGRRATVLNRSIYSIGRSRDCDLVLRSPVVSRYHASLFAIEAPESDDDNAPIYWIIDGNTQNERSTNGLLINNTRKYSHELRHGDRIVFGGGAKAEYYTLPVNNSAPLEEQVPPRSAPPPTTRSEGDSEADRDLGAITDFSTPRTSNAPSGADRFASLTELLPHPFIEFDFYGRTLYFNEAASAAFPNDTGFGRSHPLLVDIAPGEAMPERPFYRRTIEVGSRTFEQCIHVLEDMQLVRCLSIDISDRCKIEAALEQSEETNRLLVRAMPDAMLRLEPDGTICSYHAPIDRFLSIDFSDRVGQPIAEVLPDEAARILENAISETSKTGQPYAFELPGRGLCKAGASDGDGEPSDRVFEGRCVATSDGQMLAILRDITHRKRVEKVMHQQAFRDGLTGVLNRASFDRELTKILQSAQRNNTRFGVMFADLDRFKTINDTLGHDIGDAVIVQFARRLEQCVRGSDMVARWGGDEFTILLPEVPTEQLVCEIASRIIRALETPFEVGGTRPLKLGCSIGIAIYPDHGVDTRTLLKHADAALYYAKDSGRNVHKLFRTMLTERVNEQVSLEYALDRAIERDELSVYYQPQFDLGTGDVVSVEALLRWRHPQLGIVSPSRFVPIAEETGAIVEIGRWLLTQACTQLQALHNLGFPDLRVTINLSIRQFEQAGFCHELERLLEDLGLSPEFVELELTETVLAKNIERAQSVLKQLAQMGLHLALDDFGMGSSSLSYLKRFPVSALKVDRSFVANVQEDERDLAIVRTIVALGHGLNLRVVAEGVETRDRLLFLKHLGCTHAQGYYMAPPLAATEISQFLFERHLQDSRNGVVQDLTNELSTFALDSWRSDAGRRFAG